MPERNAGRVSVLADSPSVRKAIARLASRLGLRVAMASESGGSSDAGAGALLFHLAESSEQALSDLREVVRRTFPCPVIVLTNGQEGEVRRPALEAGAAEVVRLASDETRTQAALAGVLARLRRSSAGPCSQCPMPEIGDRSTTCLMKGFGLAASAPAGDTPDDGHWRSFPFLAASPAMVRLEEMARKAAAAGATVLITGESGVGKEVLARYIHWTGERSGRPFVKVDCPALPDHLLESELFGYEKGAFTGADTRKPGRFELARGGVVLLDEIGEMSLGLQAKLLRVLQDRRFTPLGGVREVEVDVQILATTNRDPEREVAAGRFRDDLYYRLRVIQLRVPPLREHPEDIPLLAKYFVCRFAAQYGQCAPELGSTALERLSDARWPGNVRELENFIRRIVILGEEALQAFDSAAPRSGPRSGDANGGESSGAGPEPAPPPARGPLTLREAASRAVRAAEREAIRTALEHTRWNRIQAARMLGVSYKTLLTKMKLLSV